MTICYVRSISCNFSLSINQKCNLQTETVFILTFFDVKVWGSDFWATIIDVSEPALFLRRYSHYHL